ncbi:hypothetical protein AXI59_01295 [Bacillus nakamurai]|uniref:hypothetical protein n=1 Tax=Bacillus nakamurai TaxID=1793963 RepID=UPI0007783A81|nr:hypothetical protein [Bacillus nakamurai]KXZ17913.1 hypothetical protein AXI59_01295 [Bacillus nakamurai]
MKINLKQPAMKLSELPGEMEIAASNNLSLLYTVDEVKAEIEGGEPHHEDRWFIIERREWKPNVDLMIDRYLDDVDEDMYEGFYEKAKANISDDVIQKIQLILEGALNKPNITDYWTLEEEVNIDIFPGEEAE